MSKSIVCSGNNEHISVGDVWNEVDSGGIELEIQTAWWCLSRLMVLQSYLRKLGVPSMLLSVMKNSKF